MRNTVVSCLGLFLLLGTALGQSKAKDSGDLMTVRGCIEHSRQNYMVVDSKGFSYVLEGVGDKLNREVGHFVEVKGTLIDDTKTGVRPEKEGSNPADTVHSSGAAATLRVADATSDVHRLADRCPSR